MHVYNYMLSEFDYSCLNAENFTIDKGHLVFNYSTAFVGNPALLTLRKI